MEVKVGAKSTRRTFAKRDQFGPEKIYFSDCMLDDREPEPAGYEGLVNGHIIRSLYKSAMTSKAVKLNECSQHWRPNLK